MKMSELIIYHFRTAGYEVFYPSKPTFSKEELAAARFVETTKPLPDVLKKKGYAYYHPRYCFQIMRDALKQTDAFPYLRVIQVNTGKTHPSHQPGGKGLGTIFDLKVCKRLAEIYDENHLIEHAPRNMTNARKTMLEKAGIDPCARTTLKKHINAFAILATTQAEKHRRPSE